MATEESVARSSGPTDRLKTRKTIAVKLTRRDALLGLTWAVGPIDSGLSGDGDHNLRFTPRTLLLTVASDSGI